MKAPEQNRGFNGGPPADSESAVPRGRMPCKEIGPLLFGYMNHELGQARATLVREHIRKCESCRAEAREIQETLALLKQASEDEKSEDVHLSEDRKRRIWRAVAHPLLDWAARHHMLVSALFAVVVLLITWLMLRHVRPIWNIEPGPPPPVDTGVRVTIDGHGWKLQPGSNGVHQLQPVPGND